MDDFKIVIVGSVGCGKSSIINRFVHNKFTETHYPTIQDYYSKTLQIKEDSYSFEIMDTSGLEDEIAFTEDFIKNSDGVIIVYSIADKKSFTNAKRAHTNIVRIKMVGFPGVLIGNKIDLEQSEREVPIEDGQSVSTDWRYSFFETSAKNSNTEIEESFQSLVTKISQYKKQNYNVNLGVSTNNSCNCNVI